MHWTLLSLFFVVDVVFCETVGWTSYVRQETSEYVDVPLAWERDCPNATVPDWLKGQLIKNGPGRNDFGGERHHLSWMDGFAKLHSFKFDGNTSDVLFSGQFVKTPIYQQCVEAGDLVPYVTLAQVGPTDWNWMETLQGLKNKFDNTNVMVWRYASHDPNVEDDFVANTDAPYVSKFDVNTLDFKELMFPAKMSMASSAHPIIEPGTNNTINFGVVYDWKMTATFEVYRYTTFKDVETVASFVPKRMAYMHSFSLTEHHAVFFFYPMEVSLWKMMREGMHPIDAMTWDETVNTDIYVVNLKTGVVDLTTETRPFFCAHHVNAYENDEGQIVVDLCQTPFENMAGYMMLDNMRAAAVTDAKLGTSKLRRFVIDPTTKDVVESDVPRLPTASAVVDSFDFPTINEARRGRTYCFAYGVSMVDYARHKLIKRGLCDPSADRIFGETNHYYSEMNFISDPAGMEEDDGILTTVAYDGVKEKSYLLLLRAKDLTELNRAYLPYRVPFHFHGNFFHGV